MPEPARITWAVEQLAAGPADRVIEIGCGPGHAVALLCEKLTSGSITAIDRSTLQVTRARERNQSWIDAGKARIEALSLSDAPDVLGERAFTRALAINVNAFWTDPAPSFASLSRLLRPGALAHLVYEPPSAARLREMRASLPELLEAHAFAIDDVRTAAFRASHGLCIIGRMAGRTRARPS